MNFIPFLQVSLSPSGLCSGTTFLSGIFPSTCYSCHSPGHQIHHMLCWWVSLYDGVFHEGSIVAFFKLTAVSVWPRAPPATQESLKSAIIWKVFHDLTPFLSQSFISTYVKNIFSYYWSCRGIYLSSFKWTFPYYLTYTLISLKFFSPPRGFFDQTCI